MNHCKELEQLLWKLETSLESGLDIVYKDTLFKPTLVLLCLSHNVTTYVTLQSKYFDYTLHVT